MPKSLESTPERTLEIIEELSNLDSPNDLIPEGERVKMRIKSAESQQVYFKGLNDLADLPLD